MHHAFAQLLTIFYFSFHRSQSSITHYIRPRWQLALALSTSQHIPTIVRYCALVKFRKKGISSGYAPAFSSLLTCQISSWFLFMVFDGISTHFIPRFLFHENFMDTSEVIALLVTAYIIHGQIFGHVLPPLTPIFTQI